MKKFFALLLCLSVMTVATACGSKEEAPAEPETEVESSATVEESSAPETEEVTEDAESAEEVTEDAETAESAITGTLEEKKDFMVTVTADGQTYAFNLAEGVECPAEVGEEITVTYEGDIEAPVADQNLTATQITVAE